MEPLRASILTIGTEVSTGQIVNSNAAWIADQLVNSKMNPVWHLTVPDDEREMLDALNLAAARSRLLFVTGGLGPTTDDITRQVISRWWGDTLEFQPGSWEKIIQRFQTLGITPPESNKQQCYFPSQARVLDNPAGTADAFYLQRKDLQIWVLPGPPEEIKAIWNTSIQRQLMELGRDSDAFRLFRWHLIGKSESAVGEIVEAAIAGSNLVSGYRPHAPYIEVKIWCRESEVTHHQPYLEKLNAALSPWLIGRDDEDSIDQLLQRFRAFSRIIVKDCGSTGAFADRLGQSWKKIGVPGLRLECRDHFPCSATEPDSETTRPAPGELLLEIQPVQEDGTWTIIWRSEHVNRQKTLKLPYRRDKLRWDRERRFISEMTIAAWSKGEDQELIA
ncbi:MAG TPA: molybdopterin-binding protein [Oligoflexus sp.]|uniref:competence/damage-inducible protein A n=1 Tax=Oligoflexus sp. TaxID=1971216 RepID=UPI002D6A1116|nr:molybdopterin-binding protein [Oligoflexus sp.]HYX36022.1 molybdopterin-binding protein [Oligoflexus sp.]